MSELLTQAFIDKLEGIEMYLKLHLPGKQSLVDLSPVLSAFDALKKEVIASYKDKSIDPKKLDELNQNLALIIRQIPILQNQKIEHKHHLHKGIWVAVGLFVSCFLLAWGWLSSHQSIEVFKANDIKYRYLKVNGNKNTLKLCQYIDSIYLKNGVDFCHNVEQEEQRLFEQVELLRLAGEREKEAKTLREQAGGFVRKP